MIEKLLRIKNVGIFAETRARGDSTRFDPLTLIYAENGRGKTTVSAILRSLATGEPAHITERSRIGTADAPEIELRVAGASRVFADDSWNSTFPAIHIFDDAFVHGNVCSGLSVSLEQRRSLHKVVIGERGVGLARRAGELDTTIRKLNAKISTLEKSIMPHIVGTMSIDQFCALPSQEDVDRAIAEKEKDLKAQQAAKSIRTTEPFSRAALPSVSSEIITALLAKSMPDVGADAAARVRSHLANLADGAEEWISNGMAHCDDDTCPFCGQDIRGLPLLNDYQSYFSEAYTAFKKDVSEAKCDIERKLGGDALATFVQQIAAEEAKRVFWAGFTDVPDNAYEPDRIKACWSAVQRALSDLLAKKVSAPLETMALDADTTTALADFEALSREVCRSSEALADANEEIGRIKSDTSEPNEREAVAALNRLKSTKSRHTRNVALLCGHYTEAVAVRDKSKTEKDEAKKELRTLSGSIFKRYGTAINKYLVDFGAEFEIGGIKEAHEGGKPGSTYEIVINGAGVKLGKNSTPMGTRCFRNTLSSGDRNALALAFFLARLDQEASLTDVVVVFDDPISSLDEHRQMRTQQHICRLAQDASQVIVLSHSAPFLRKVWDHPGTPAKNAMKIARGVLGSVIEEWEIEQETEAEYHKLRSVLVDFRDSNTGMPRTVANSIRPLLEGYLRVVYPEHIRPGRWLGDFMTSASAAHDTGSPIITQDDYHELDHLRTYSNPFHHNTNPTGTDGPINETELLAFVNKTLDFVAHRNL